MHRGGAPFSQTFKHSQMSTTTLTAKNNDFKVADIKLADWGRKDAHAG